MTAIRRHDHIPGAAFTGGPYAQAVVHGSVVYVAGQIPWNVLTQQPFKGSVADETKNIFKNLAVILSACGSSLGHIIRVTAFLSNPNQAKEFSATYNDLFAAETLPVRTMVFVAALPLGASIELEVTAATV